MVVYATSDLHGNLPDVPGDADVVLLAGDICPDFRPPRDNHYDMVDKGGTRQRDWMMNDFNRWVDTYVKEGVRFVYIWGNHDFVGEQTTLVEEIKRHVPAQLIQDSMANLKDLKVWGTPWVPGLLYWAFYGSDMALDARADLIPGGLDVLMTHGPPLGHGDFIPTSEKQQTKYGNFGGEHVGDKFLNDAIELTKPKVVICGHIHEDRGRHEVGGVPVLNVAAVDAAYNLHPLPFVRLYELEA